MTDQLKMEWQPIETVPKDRVVRVPLTKGKFALVDELQYPKVSGRSWQAQERSDGKGFYAVSNGVRMHRLLMDPESHQIIDHIDGDGLNNTLGNLRIGLQSQNCVNRKVTPGRHLRGARPKKSKWQAYIKYQGRQRSLGYYETEAQAHEAYLAEAEMLHGDWMPLPSPPKE